MIMYKATVLKDTSETAYTTVYEKLHKTKKGAEDAIKNIFGCVKYVKPIEIED